MMAHARLARGAAATARGMVRVGAIAALAPLLVLLSGCGGGGDNDPSVSTLAASNARYSRTATVAISGRNLRAGIHVSAEGGCENLTPVPNGSDDLQQYTCDVLAIGEHRIEVHAAGDGRFLARLVFQVPQPEVVVATSAGTITLELDAVKAPLTTRNFLNYVGTGFYRNTLVHAAIPGRGLIAGGYTTGLAPKAATAPAIVSEAANGLKNLRGTLGMVRGATADTATTQWYVNTADNADLDFVDAAQPGYAVFGRVVGGLEVADAITAVPTRSIPARDMTDVPVTEILITAATQTR